MGFLSEVRESLTTMGRPCEFLELKLHSTCDLCPQRTVRKSHFTDTCLRVIPGKSNICLRLGGGALPSV